MRVLTVRQPWAWAIMHGGKDVENRTRSLGQYRGPVAIHAGLAFDNDAWNFDPLNDATNAAIDAERDLPRDHECRTYMKTGAIIGIVDLVDVHHGRQSEGGPPTCWRRADTLGWVPWDDRDPFGPYPDFDPIEAECSPWGMRDHHHLVLSNPRPLATPVPAKGRLGLWRPDADLVAGIASQLFDLAEGGV